MPNYRRQQSTRYGKRARGVSTLIITAIVIIAVFLGLRVLLSGSTSNNNEGNEHDIQTLESLLENVNVPVDAGVGAGGETTDTQVCTGVVRSIDTEEKIVALTFDSINITDHASDIMTTLKEKNVPAFFFLTGDFSNDNPELVQSIQGNGFSIGNHSNTHRDFTTLETSDIVSELALARESIIEAGGTPTMFMRPPFNKYNDTVIATIIDEGYCPILWSLDSEDWKQDSTPDDVIANVTNNLTPGAIIWMLYGHETAASALPTIIDNVRSAGYQFVNLADYITEPTKDTP